MALEGGLGTAELGGWEEGLSERVGGEHVEGDVQGERVVEGGGIQRGATVLEVNHEEGGSEMASEDGASTVAELGGGKVVNREGGEVEDREEEGPTEEEASSREPIVGPKKEEEGPKEGEEGPKEEEEGPKEEEDEASSREPIVGPKEKEDVVGEGKGAASTEVPQANLGTRRRSTRKAKTVVVKSARETLTYWKSQDDGDGFDMSTSIFEGSFPDRFLTFETDFGGFNNVRMALEVLCLTALLTERTLVIPPPSAWYLLDWGTSTRIDIEGASVSDFADFFDLGDLGRAIDVITTDEFLEVEKSDWSEEEGFPAPFAGGKAKGKDFWREESNRTQWFAYLRKTWVKDKWNPFDVILMYPGVFDVFKAPRGVRPDERMLGERRYIEVPHSCAEFPVIHFPMDNDNGYRALGQIATVAALGEARMHTEMHRFLRDSIHYRADIVDIAIQVVEGLGLHGFSSYHIRRNDLQYPSAFQEASASLENTRKLLTEGETLYFSTDESDPAFFGAFEDAGFKVLKWEDLFTDKGGRVLAGVDVDPKVVGLVEQFICAAGRVFIGTKYSTYTSYVFRIRGYMHAPDLTQYVHNVQYTQPGPGYDPSPAPGFYDLFVEHPVLWEDI